MANANFVATQTAKITYSSKRARKYDTTVRDSRKATSQLTVFTLVLVAITALLIWLKLYIIAAIPGIIGIICLGLLFMFLSNGGAKKLEKIYTEGLLVPAIIRKTSPLTILALVSLENNNNVPPRYGCREFAVYDLPGHTLRKGERIPCAAMFGLSDDPGYFSNFEVHPLCCATADMNEVRRNADEIDSPEDWEILNQLAETLPDNDCNMMYILDENHEPLISRNCDSNSGAEYGLTQESKKLYQKRYDTLPDYRADHPDMELFLKLAQEHQVAEYFLSFEGDSSKGYVTLMNNPGEAEKYMAAHQASFASDEVLFTATRTAATNKGLWDSKGFTPWKDVSVHLRVSGKHSNTIATALGETKSDLASFEMCYDLYPVKREDIEAQIAILKSLETERLTSFWLAVKHTFSAR